LNKLFLQLSVPDRGRKLKHQELSINYKFYNDLTVSVNATKVTGMNVLMSLVSLVPAKSESSVAPN